VGCMMATFSFTTCVVYFAFISTKSGSNGPRDACLGIRSVCTPQPDT
jgi:hypothetical protein